MISVRSLRHSLVLVLLTAIPVLHPFTISASAVCGDIDCSGTATATDALLVLQRAVGLLDEAQCSESCATPTTSSTVTTTTTNSTTGPPACIANPALDPEDTIAEAVAGKAIAVPVQANSNGGIFDVVLEDDVGGLLCADSTLSHCESSPFLIYYAESVRDFTFYYVAPNNDSESVTLGVVFNAHSPGFGCGNDAGYGATKTIPIGTASQIGNHRSASVKHDSAP